MDFLRSYYLPALDAGTIDFLPAAQREEYLELWYHYLLVKGYYRKKEQKYHEAIEQYGDAEYFHEAEQRFQEARQEYQEARQEFQEAGQIIKEAGQRVQEAGQIIQEAGQRGQDLVGLTEWFQKEKADIERELRLEFGESRQTTSATTNAKGQSEDSSSDSTSSGEHLPDEDIKMAEVTSDSPQYSVPQVALHKIPPLAPSQELAYRSKCIELRRRLTEIEKNNDATRKRIEQERRFHDKMRLNRVVLLNHLKDMTENGRRLTPEELQNLSMGGRANLAEQMGYDTSGSGIQGNPQSAAYLDDDSDGTEEEEINEPQERPLRSKRAHHRGDISMNVSPSVPATADPSNNNNAQAEPQQVPPQPSLYKPLAPASSQSPIPNQDNLTSTFRINHTSGAAATTPTPLTQAPSQSSFSFSPPVTDAPQPLRPTAPFDRYSAIHTPQLHSAGAVPSENVPTAVRKMWQDEPEDEKYALQEEYEADMLRYEQAMDEWKKARKLGGGAGGSFRGGNE